MSQPWSYIDAREQIAIPKDILNQLNLRPGDKIEFTVEDGRLILTNVEGGHNKFAEWMGIAPVPESEGDAVERQREMRGWDEFDYREVSE